MRYLVTGGRSPLAVAVVKVLNGMGMKSVLITRQIDTTMRDLVGGYEHCSLREWDFADSSKTCALFAAEHQQESFDGIVMMHRYRGLTDDRLQYQVEVLTPYELIKAFSDSATANGAAVVIATSPGARVVVSDQPFQYHASKAALVSLVRFSAVKYASKGLRVNGISPGAYVEKQRSAQFYADNPQRAEWARCVTPLGRQARDHEVADVVKFLLSAESSFVTGQIIEVDGGVSLQDQPSLDPARMPNITPGQRPTGK